MVEHVDQERVVLECPFEDWQESREQELLGLDHRQESWLGALLLDSIALWRHIFRSSWWEQHRLARGDNIGGENGGGNQIRESFEHELVESHILEPTKKEIMSVKLNHIGAEIRELKMALIFDWNISYQVDVMHMDQNGSNHMYVDKTSSIGTFSTKSLTQVISQAILGLGQMVMVGVKANVAIGEKQVAKCDITKIISANSRRRGSLMLECLT